MKIRTKYLDDMLEKHLHSHVRQVVILGAGLDTRAVRKQAAGVRYFEIDDAATLKLKQACYGQHGIDVDVKFIPGNYVTDGLIDLRGRTAGFDAPTFFIWEGNTMMPPDEQQIKHTSTELRIRQTLLASFDYMAEAVVSKTTRSGHHELVESRNHGAPVAGHPRPSGSGARIEPESPRTSRPRSFTGVFWLGRPMTSPISVSSVFAGLLNQSFQGGGT